MLAVGRLAAAEDALYAAVATRPRAPAPRGALGKYLASRARFRIAEILLTEAMRFGADSGSVLRAIAAMAPYRAGSAVPAPAVSVAFRVSEDGRTLGAFAVRTTDGARTAVLDPTITGIVARRVMREFWVGERRFAAYVASTDPSLSNEVLRVGLDVLWSAHPMVDEVAGTLTLGRAPDVANAAGTVAHIPFVLAFPGLLLVPQPGLAPHALQSSGGRALLRGTRWQVSAATATVTVVR
jgi:hypothetical protein